MVSPDLVLDREVRDWVLVPLTLSIMLMMLLRQYVHQVFMSAPPKSAAVDEREAKEKQAVSRSQVLRTFCGFIPDAAFRQRRSYFIAKDTGVFSKKSVAKSAQEQMMANPDMLSNMMKQNVSGIVPQIAMGTFVNYFFSGFILGKIPFSLSPSFRPMLQRGLDLPSLDVTYFTSLSYYILLLFGLRGVFTLVFREDTIDETQVHRQQMQMGMGMGGQDNQKMFDAEKQVLEILDHKWRLEGIEDLAASTLRARLSEKQAGRLKLE
ncbi:hypothetical protein WJX72_007320 [[Myrmecia] bisecta]|uniref:ER membrane protein complex subunit 3 n=1 Tax=[Myrmecia] bisecta TaxID=41462 RepID=A0AAW1Q5M7_9CHLO